MSPIKPQTEGGKKVVVAMSGGVDSSVAAALLVQAGYDVTGIMMRLWSEPGPNTGVHNRCCTPDQMADARRVAQLLQIPFYVVDAQAYFRREVVQFFIDEHQRAVTPNPCVECNRKVRFSYLLERARLLGADFLATGHYARVQPSADGYQLLKAVDGNKDQSYVLHVLNQQKLARVLLPLGPYAKREVRCLAKEFGLPVASKQESMDLCFLRDGNYRRFLAEHSTGASASGPILSQTGETLGQHDGLPSYTIGQRKGLGIAVGEPMYVIDKDPDLNALIVGPRTALGRSGLLVGRVNWIAGGPPSKRLDAEVKIRYRSRPVEATVTALDERMAQIRFRTPVFGATAGQAAVFYQGDRCLGGGIISEVLT
ncbi:MAG: tRNA 2-thiouridine(34) synthase MnmA [Candidatus Promineifilaceae bacterium]|nr:tRNA 2-thiouridine(34) synthase MnmA [Candidatus Promineifilaceae bacterium]